jgi:23S rRNA pseudouridine1911/1915/1917 synthase
MAGVRVEGAATLGQVLAGMFPDSSGRTRKRMLETGRVVVNGTAVKVAKTALRPGDVIEVRDRRSAPEAGPRLPPGLRVVHEDDDVIVAAKGPGLLTIATAKERVDTAYAWLRARLKARDPGAKIFIVHRLDRLASGLLVFAKSPEAKRTLQAELQAHTMERVYVAVVEGRVEEKEGVIRSRLVEDPSGRVRETRPDGPGLEAVTRFKVLLAGRRFSTLEVRLETGRKHQIRVHLAGRGHPVVGDPVHGTGTDPIGRLALHARTLGFDHPRTGERVVFESPAPAEFKKLRG